MQTYEITKYPNLFKKTYWGTFNINESEKGYLKTIQNRNEFVEKYKLKSVIDPSDGITILNSCDLFDHVEYYKTKDNKILILTSPYKNSANDFASKLGFSSAPTLYNEIANSYIRIFETLKEFKMFEKALLNDGI